jgi:hypothetical protein
MTIKKWAALIIGMLIIVPAVLHALAGLYLLLIFDLAFFLVFWFWLGPDFSEVLSDLWFRTFQRSPQIAGFWQNEFWHSPWTKRAVHWVIIPLIIGMVIDHLMVTELYAKPGENRGNGKNCTLRIFPCP